MMRVLRCFPLLLVVPLLGCMEGTKSNPLTRTAPLYERLGGERAIRKVVDDFVVNVIDDPELTPAHKAHFKRPDVDLLKQKLVTQIGEATGGPQKYTGKNMKHAHHGLGISDAHFNALVKDLQRALNKNGVAETDQRELLSMLEPMRKDIVEK